MQDIEIQCINTGDNMNCLIPASDPFFTPFFSSGDIMISILLFIIIVLSLVKLLRGGLNSVNIKRKFTGNNSPDGKEDYTL
jgi:hypothetical protein